MPPQTRRQLYALIDPHPRPLPTTRKGAWEEGSKSATSRSCNSRPHHSWPLKSSQPPSSPALTAAFLKTSCCATTTASSPRSNHPPRPPPAREDLRHPRFRQRPRPRPPDRVLVRRGRHAAGELDPPLGHRHPARRLSRRRLRDGPLGPIRLRRHDDPLHPADRQTAAGRGGKGDRARRQRCRHPHRLCARGARPEPDRLWRQRTCIVRACARAPQRARGIVRPPGDDAARLHQTDRDDCHGNRRPAGRCAVRPRRHPVVLARAARRHRRELGAHRPPRPHASSGDRLPARLCRPAFSRRRRRLAPRHRPAVTPADAGPWHPRPPRRTRHHRRLRRADRHQFLLQPASAFRPRPDRRRAHNAAAPSRSASTASRSTRTTT